MSYYWPMTSHKNRHTMAWGVFFTLFGGAFWGISGTSVQYLTTTAGASPALITMMRVFLGGALFLVYILVKQRAALREMFSNRRYFVGILVFGLSLYGNQIFYAQTVQLTNAGTATVLQMLGAAFVMLYVCLRERHLPHLREFTGLVIAIIASVFIATKGNLGQLSIDPLGLFAGIMAGLATAFYIVVPKQFGLFEKFGSVPVVGVGMFLGTVFAIPVYLAQGGTVPSAVSMLSVFGPFEWGVFFVGVVLAGTVAGYGFYLHGVSIVGSVRGSLLEAIEPVSATIVAALWLKTAFTGYDIAGLILMCIMVALVSDTEEEKGEQGT